MLSNTKSHPNTCTTYYLLPAPSPVVLLPCPAGGKCCCPAEIQENQRCVLVLDTFVIIITLRTTFVNTINLPNTCVSTITLTTNFGHHFQFSCDLQAALQPVSETLEGRPQVWLVAPALQHQLVPAMSHATRHEGS